MSQPLSADHADTSPNSRTLQQSPLETISQMSDDPLVSLPAVAR